MEEKLMGYKKNFIIEDFSLFFIGIIVIPIFSVLIITQFFQLQSSLGAIIFNVALFCINLITIKCYYYESIKYFMKKGYNFKLKEDKIEVLLKKEDNVIIDFKNIKEYKIYTYSYIFKQIFYLLSMSDTNFRKDIFIIKLNLYTNDNYKRKNLYYNLFNYSNRKKNGVTITLYEIIYNEESYSNISLLKEKLSNI